MDIFLEKIVKRRRSLMDMVLTSLYITVAIMASYFALVFLGFSLAPLLILGIGYLAWYLVSLRNIEFEYAVTNGDIDIDMIVNQRKRKRVLSANCKDFEVVAPITSMQYTKEIREIKNVRNFTSQSPSAEVWFIYWRHDKGPQVVLFEPTSQMIDSFRMQNPRKVHLS